MAVFPTKILIRHGSKCYGRQAQVLFTYQCMPSQLLSVYSMWLLPGTVVSGLLALYSGDAMEVITLCKWLRSNGAHTS